MPGPRTAESVVVPVRSAHFVWTRSTTADFDNLGHPLVSVASGRLHDEDDPGYGLVAYGEAITQHATLGFVAGAESGWMLRPVSQYVTGEEAPGLHLGATSTTYNALGDATGTSQTVVAPVTLDFGAGSDGRATPYTYVGGVTTQVLTASSLYDAFGNVRATCAGGSLTSLGAVPASCLRYASTTYDAVYAQLPVAESVATGAGGSPALTTTATWERGLGALLTATDPNGVSTSVSYDGLGRKSAIDLPDVGSCNPGGPEQRFRYVLADALGLPVSYVETESEAGVPNADATSCTAGQTTIARAYMDGLGRARASVMRTPDVGTTAAIVSGVVELDARGQTRVAYDPRFVSTDDPAPNVALAVPTGTPRVQAVFDPFGRAVAATAQDGSTARTVYRASSVLTYDPNDDPTQNPGQPWHHDTPTLARKDGHGRDLEQVQQLRNPGELASQVRYLHLLSRTRADGVVTLVTRRETATSAPATHAACTLAGRCVQRTFTYDTAGRRVTSTDPDADSRTAPGPASAPGRSPLHRADRMVVE